MERTSSAGRMYDSPRRFFAMHFGAFAASSFLAFFLSQALGWGLSATLSSLSLANALALLAMFTMTWLPHAIFVGANRRLRRQNPFVTGFVGAFVLVAMSHATELFVQRTSNGTGTSEVSGLIMIPILGLFVASSLLSVLAIGSWTQPR